MLLYKDADVVLNKIASCKMDGVGFQRPIRGEAKLNVGDEIHLSQRKRLHCGLSKRY